MQMAFLVVKCSSFRDVAAVVIVWEAVDIGIIVMEWCAGFLYVLMQPRGRAD